MTVRVGLTAPWDLDRLHPTERQARLAAVADAGIDHLFTADHVSFVGGNGIDGVVRLAAWSGIEPRLDLHLGVFLLALRHPMVAARQIATLAEAAPGRVVIGVGVGGEDRHEFEVCGVDPATRGRRTDVALDLVRRLLAGETVDGDGEFFDFEAGRIRPTPTPSVPFVVGGRSDAAVHRAGRLGDGWLAAWCSPRRFAEATAEVERVGADREVDWRHGLQTWVGVGVDRVDARSHVAEGMAAFYGLPFEPFETYTPVGTADDIVEFLAPYVDAGAHTLNLTPCGPDRATELEVMAEVAERLRSR
ncbi:MAG: LLM class flavin-dependent oxidoreductase [Actinomycetota bacterium]